MTTNTPDRAELTAAVQRIAAELKRAQKDLVLLQRLKDAEANAKRLGAELEKAQADLIEASAAALAAKRAEAYAHFQDIKITTAGSGSILDLHFPITLTRSAFNGFDTVRTTFNYPGFIGLPHDVFPYLIEVHPERIPTAIMALSPDDPWEAFDRYFAAKRRGYLNTAAA